MSKNISTTESIEVIKSLQGNTCSNIKSYTDRALSTGTYSDKLKREICKFSGDICKVLENYTDELILITDIASNSLPIKNIHELRELFSDFESGSIKRIDDLINRLNFIDSLN